MSYSGPITIHDSGVGGERLRVDSYGHGAAYNVRFGEAGAPMRNLFFQGEDAAALRDQFDALETARPNDLTREIWMEAVDPYL